MLRMCKSPKPVATPLVGVATSFLRSQQRGIYLSCRVIQGRLRVLLAQHHLLYGSSQVAVDGTILWPVVVRVAIACGIEKCLEARMRREVVSIRQALQGWQRETRVELACLYG